MRIGQSHERHSSTTALLTKYASHVARVAMACYSQDATFGKLCGVESLGLLPLQFVGDHVAGPGRQLGFDLLFAEFRADDPVP